MDGSSTCHRWLSTNPWVLRRHCEVNQIFVGLFRFWWRWPFFRCRQHTLLLCVRRTTRLFLEAKKSIFLAVGVCGRARDGWWMGSWESGPSYRPYGPPSMERCFVMRLAYPLRMEARRLGSPRDANLLRYISINVRAMGRARLYSQGFSRMCVRVVVVGLCGVF